MSAFLGKAGKSLFARNLEQYAPPDPLYEVYTNEQGKQKRRQRPLPPGLSKRDARILKSVQRRAHYLDKGFTFCGFRCGWTFFIGLIPVVGDITDISLNYFLVVRKARKADLPPWLVKRMLVNNALSAAVGLIPFVGDLILAIYKANSRNAALLEEFLRIRGEEYLKLHIGPDGQVVMAETVNGPGGKKGSIFMKRKGVSKKDAEQVKPGSGLKEGEVVPTAPVDPDLVDEHGDDSTPTASPTPMPGGSNLINPSGEKKGKAVATSSPGKGKRGFSLFGNGKKATTPPGDRGRFIEDVGASDTLQQKT